MLGRRENKRKKGGQQAAEWLDACRFRERSIAFHLLYNCFWSRLVPNNLRRRNTDFWKRGTDIATAVATAVAAASLTFAYLSYRDQERTSRLQRTQTVLAEASKEYVDDTQRAAMFKFTGRGTDTIDPMSDTEANTYFTISDKPDTSENYIKWNAARKHLNILEGLSFAYIHNLADEKILAEVSCLEIVRSYEYFASLIEKFTKGHPAHGWLDIPKAARLLEAKYGPECQKVKE